MVKKYNLPRVTPSGVRVVHSDAILTAADGILFVDATTDVTVYVPDPSILRDGRKQTIKKVSDNTHEVIIEPMDAITINGDQRCIVNSATNIITDGIRYYTLDFNSVDSTVEEVRDWTSEDDTVFTTKLVRVDNLVVDHTLDVLELITALNTRIDNTLVVGDLIQSVNAIITEIKCKHATIDSTLAVNHLLRALSAIIDSSVLVGTVTPLSGAQVTVAGGLSAGMPRVVVPNTLMNISDQKCYGTLINNKGQTADNTLYLPTAKEGLNFIAQVSSTGVGSQNFKAKDTDKIYLDGTALDDGDKVTLATPAAGNYATFFTIEESDGSWNWVCAPGSGTWTDGGI